MNPASAGMTIFKIDSSAVLGMTLPFDYTQGKLTALPPSLKLRRAVRAGLAATAQQKTPSKTGG